MERQVYVVVEAVEEEGWEEGDVIEFDPSHPTEPIVRSTGYGHSFTPRLTRHQSHLRLLSSRGPAGRMKSHLRLLED